MTIPVYINNRNLVTSPKAMVEYLRQIPEAEPIIVDNASTYPPLLDWYEEGQCQVIYTGTNGGPQAWRRHVDESAEFYVGTDPDLDLSGIPPDMLDVFRNALLEYPSIGKVGPSLRVDDVTDTRTTDIEANYWKTLFADGWWDAGIDTTFAMYQRGRRCGPYGPAVRADKPYTARHLPWYWTADTVGDEERFYLKEATCAGLCYSPRIHGEIEAEMAENRNN